MGANTMKSQSFFVSSTALGLLIRANKLKADGDDRAALALYFEVLERFGESAELLAAIADCYFSLALGNPDEPGENHEQAVSCMKRAIALASNSPRLHAHLAQFYALGPLSTNRRQKSTAGLSSSTRTMYGLSSTRRPSTVCLSRW